MLEDGVNLVSRDSRKPFQEIADGGAALDVLKECAHRNSRPAKQPFTTDLSGNAFDGRTFNPIQHAEVYSKVQSIETSGRHERNRRRWANRSAP